MTLAELNRMDEEQFVEALGWVYEDSPWVARRAWSRRPFSTVAALGKIMEGVVAAASSEEQIALIRAHPDLGTRARMSEASVGEQAGAGVQSLTGAEFEHLRTSNAQYKRKFGFPFIYAVKGSTKHDIIGALDRRLNSTPEAEQEIALAQIGRIAAFRLADAILQEQT